MQKQAEAEKIKSHLIRRGYEVEGAYQSGSQALSRCYNFDEGIIVCSERCTDMMSTELKGMLPDGFEMILLAKPSDGEDSVDGVIRLELPLRVSALAEAIDICMEGMRRKKRAKTGARIRSAQEQAMIDMAKQRVMKSRGLSEQDAYRYLQKMSMNLKCPLEEFAATYLLNN